ncbi:hypothetical protein [Tropicimonas sediminicola]|uniref:Uncharacterized protein n=1 Tax=Tropicimonas sediminicola TaxID=1031541 RepID=A0A239K2N8_9RHOB|nr:hypothetical protein [Tropicimonas sediminicola]SNT12250.1 hypothetical protein SAMN05421757_106205 [Tropicimonas sediminicola]
MVETSGVRALPSDDGFGGENRSEDPLASPFDRWERSFQETGRTRDKARPSGDASDGEATSRRAPSGKSPVSKQAAPGDKATGKELEFGLREKELARRRRQRELAETAKILNNTSDPRKAKDAVGGASVSWLAGAKAEAHGGERKPRAASDGSVSFLEDSLPDPEDLLRSLQETEWRMRHSGDHGPGEPDFGDSHDPGPLIAAGELRLEAAPLPFEVERAEVAERRLVSRRMAGISALVLVPVLAVAGYLALPDRAGDGISASPEVAEIAAPSSGAGTDVAVVSTEAPAVVALAPERPTVDAPEVPAPIIGADTPAAATESPVTEETVIAALPAAESPATEILMAEPQPQVPTAVETPQQVAGAEVTRPKTAAVADAASEPSAGAPASVDSQRLAGVTPAAVAESAPAGEVAMPTGEQVASVTTAPSGTVGMSPDVVGPVAGGAVSPAPSVVTMASVDAGSPVVAARVLTPASSTPVPQPPQAREAALRGGEVTLRPVSDPLQPALAASVAAAPSGSDLLTPARAVMAPATDAVAVTVERARVLRASAEASSAILPQLRVSLNQPLRSPQPTSIVGVVPNGTVVTASLDGGVPVRPMPRRAIAAEPSVLAGRPDVATLTGQETVLAPGAQISLFAPGSLGEADVAAVMERLAGSGFAPSEPSRVGFSISQSNIRYYHAEDAEVAAAVAEASGALLRDFTGKASVPPGTIELWLAGDGGGAVATARPATKKTVAAAPKKQRTGPSEAERTARLRSQVLSKLRSATSQ